MGVPTDPIKYEEWRNKISIAHTGLKHSQETKEKIRKNHARNRLGIKLTDEQKHKMRIISKKLGLRPPPQTNVIWSEERRKRASISHKGAKSSNWKGGKTSKSILIRHSLEYRLWREKVFKLADYTCFYCHKRGGRLNAHHNKYSFSQYPKYRFEIWNGVALCEECHKTTPDYLKNIKPDKVILNLIRYIA